MPKKQSKSRVERKHESTMVKSEIEENANKEANEPLSALEVRQALANSRRVSPQTIQNLHSTIGNRAVQRLLQRQPPAANEAVQRFGFGKKKKQAEPPAKKPMPDFKELLYSDKVFFNLLMNFSTKLNTLESFNAYYLLVQYERGDKNPLRLRTLAKRYFKPTESWAEVPEFMREDGATHKKEDDRQPIVNASSKAMDEVTKLVRDAEWEKLATLINDELKIAMVDTVNKFGSSEAFKDWQSKNNYEGVLGL